MLRTSSIALGSTPSRRPLRLESLENRHMLSHPAVAAVNVAGTDWTPGFISYLESSGQGVGGYAIPVGSPAQLQALPWANVNKIRVTFSEDVVVAAADLSVSGVNQTAYAFSGFTYDPGTHTATWTLAAPFGLDKLMLDLDADGLAPVRSVSTGEVLAGAWTDGQSSFPSGNGQGGADFQFRFNVLPGNANGNAWVEGADLNIVLSHYNQTGMTWAQGDFNGDGTVNGADMNTVLSNYNQTLPSGDPAGMTNDAPTTSGIPDLSIAKGTIDHVLSLTDFFADAETPPADMVYSVVQNSNPSLFTSLAIDSGNIILTFDDDVTGDATITIRGEDSQGLIVETTFATHVSAAPVITDFYCIKEVGDYWTLTGIVSDADDPVQGDVITFGGVLADYHFSTTVREDGVFSFTVELYGFQSGMGWAATTDPHGVLSNLAGCWIMA
jgi:hypothetical protein